MGSDLNTARVLETLKQMGAYVRKNKSHYLVSTKNRPVVRLTAKGLSLSKREVIKRLDSRSLNLCRQTFEAIYGGNA